MVTGIIGTILLVLAIVAIIAVRDRRRRRLERQASTAARAPDFAALRARGAADQHRLVDQLDAEPLLHAVADLAGEVEELGGGGRPAVGQRERVLGGEPDPLAAVALGEACVLDQPGGAHLDRRGLVRLRPGRRAVRYGVGRDDRVGEERAGAPGVVVLGVEHHPLAAAQRQHRLANLGRRSALRRPRRRARSASSAYRTGAPRSPRGSWKVVLEHDEPRPGSRLKRLVR